MGRKIIRHSSGFLLDPVPPSRPDKIPKKLVDPPRRKNHGGGYQRLSNQTRHRPGWVQPGRPAAASSALTPLQHWDRVDPSRAGFDAAALARVDALCDDLTSRGLAVIDAGRIVHTYAPEGVGLEQQFNTWSMGKSFTAALVGIAIRKGMIDSLDQPVIDFIPEWRSSSDPRRARVTVRHLLSGTSGLKWGLIDDYLMSLFSANKTREGIEQPMGAEPGTQWRYNNHAVQLLERVLERAVGGDVEDFARRHLWRPIGMSEKTDWERDAAGNVTSFSSVFASVEDLARFGLLLSRDGKWGNRQVIPADFVREMTRPSQVENPNYGFLTWTKAPADSHRTNTNFRRSGSIMPAAPDGTFAVEGVGQNFMAVIPDQDLIIVHLKAAPLIERNRVRKTRSVFGHIANFFKDAWSLLTDGNRTAQNDIVEAVLAART